MAIQVRITKANGEIREIAARPGETIRTEPGDRIELVDVERDALRIQADGEDVIIHVDGEQPLRFEDLALHLAAGDPAVMTFAGAAQGGVIDSIEALMAATAPTESVTDLGLTQNQAPEQALGTIGGDNRATDGVLSLSDLFSSDTVEDVLRARAPAARSATDDSVRSSGNGEQATPAARTPSSIDQAPAGDAGTETIVADVTLTAAPVADLDDALDVAPVPTLVTPVDEAPPIDDGDTPSGPPSVTVMGDDLSIVLSTHNGATLGGLSFGDGDMVEYDPVADGATLYLDGEGAGNLFSGNEDIDAVAMLANGHILLSTAGDATLGGLSFGDGDIVEYDPVADSATLFFDGEGDGNLFSGNADVDAVSLLADGHIVLSTAGGATLGGLSFGDGDIVEYDPVSDTASLLFDGEGDGNNFSRNEDVDAVEILGSDILSGGAGADIIFGGTGRDVFDYDDLGEGGDTILDFEVGSGGDVLDISDLLADYDDGVDDIDDFLELRDDGTDTTVSVDADGGGDGFTDIAVLHGVSGASLDNLIDYGNLDLVI